LILESVHGCIDSITHQFEIVEPPVLNLLKPPAFCATALPYILQATPAGGTWSGSGVSGSIFDPLTAGPGSHTVFYELIQGGCRVIDSMTLIVNPPPIVNIVPVTPACFGDPFFQLNANPGGGQWSGTGVIDPSGIFDPVTAGSGLHTVTYTYREGACNFPYTTNIRVYPELNAQFNTDAIVCLTSETLARFSGVAPAGTAFDWVVTNGTIVENDNEGNIRIQWNASGTNRISLRLSIADCEAGPFSRDVIVEQPLETPQLDCDSLSTTSVHFSWLDVTNAIGYEVRYGSQVDTIVTNQYAVTGIPAGSQLSVQITVVALGNGICGNSAPAIIECTSLPCPDIRLIPEDEDIDLCVFPNSSPTQLIINIINSDGSGVGVWSGPGVNPSGRFDPRAVNEGTHLVTFTLTEQSCPYNANIVIRTFLPPIAEWEADKYLVCTDEIVVLDFTGILRRGGTPIWDFDGAEIVSGTGFGPYELRWSNGGQKNVTLMVDDSQCRSALYERMIDVEAPLELPLISCESNPISVRFFWDQVPGATGFVIVINNGAPININPTDTSYLITGLNQGDRVSIRVYATGDGVCGNGPEAYFECEAKECPRINVEIDDVAPICLTSATAPVQLQLSISGSNQTGTGLWSGPGVNQNGMFNPSVAGPGLHSIDYRFTEEFCNYFANVQIRVHPQPNANFSIAGPVCTGQLINAVHPGNLIPGSVYHWSVDGAQINSGAGTSNIQLRWATPGIKTIRLIVYENGCPSEPVTRQLEVEAPLTAPIINCEPSTTEILFRWEEVPGASAYEVQINGNPVFVTTDLARLVDGLTVGQQVTITIRALGSVVCGNGPYTTLICEAEPCPIIQVQIRQEPFICLSSTTQPIQLAVQVSGEVVNGTGFWSGNGITDLQNGRFDPQLAGIGTHEIIYTFREKGCNYMDTIQISVRPQPINAFSSPGPICVGQELDVQFTGSATGAAIFQWALDGATIISGEGTRVLELLWTTAGIKTIRLQVNDNGCISAPVSQTVEVQRPLLDPVIRCNSTLTSIGFSWDPVQNSEGYLISINGGPPFVFNGTSYPFPDMTPGDSITFRVIAINNGPCGNSGFDELTCFAADCRDVVLTFEQVPPICNYPNAQDITLKAIATNGHGGGAFTWSGPGITSPSRGTFNPGVAGLGSHEVAVTYRESVCPYRSSFIVRVVDIPVLTVDTFSPVCFGIHTGVIEIERVINGEEPYQFSINNGGFSSAMRFASLSPGVYQVSVRDQNGCMATVPATLIQPDRLTVNLGPDRLEEAGEEFEIIPIFNVPDGEIVSYYWYGFDQISCPTCPLALMTLFEQTRIYIEVEDIRGCKALDDVNIAVRKKRRVFIPTSFSPNNDGINDFFTVFSAEEVESVELMQIFDRWGEKLFTKSDFPPNEEIEGWDGSHGGRSLNPGVFVYHFRVRFRDGSTGDYQGDVTLLKN
jgi:gliding motility-associated-like protein